MASEIKKYYEFGKFRFDARRLRLEHEGAAVQLPPKSLETLKVLLELRGETVTRENLLEKIWAESFVEDANLTVAVSTLRKTLAIYDDRETFIQTVPRRGYRFVAETEEKIEIPEAPIVVARHALEQITIEQSGTRPVSKFIAIILVLIAAGGGFGVWLHGTNALSAKEIDRQAAIEAFSRGHAFLQKRETCESIPYFRDAAAKDLTFARAYANLAAALAMCGDKRGEAEEAIARAIRLDPNSAEAHATDGFIRMFRGWEWDEAEKSLRRAVALDPNSMKAHHWLAVNLSLRGHFTEAAGELRRALEIEPNSALLHADLCQLHYLERRYDRALEVCGKAFEIDPHFLFTPAYLRDIYLMKADEQAAIEWELRKISGSGEQGEEIKRILRREGFRIWARRKLDTLFAEYDPRELKPADRAVVSFHAADYYAILEDRENTLFWLEAAVASEGSVRPFWLPYVAVDPRYQFLRENARFRALLRKMNLS